MPSQKTKFIFLVASVTANFFTKSVPKNNRKVRPLAFFNLFGKMPFFKKNDKQNNGAVVLWHNIDFVGIMRNFETWVIFSCYCL